MRITWDELTVNFEGVEGDFMASWRWLIGNTATPVLITSLGDAFFREADGSVYWLDVGGGNYHKVAETEEDFKTAMAEHAEEWFIPQLVMELMSFRGLTLGPNQCFGFITSPAVGGEFDPDNFEPTDIDVHFTRQGRILEQAKRKKGQ